VRLCQPGWRLPVGAAAVLLALLGPPAPCRAQPVQAGLAAAAVPIELAISGRVEQPRTLALADLQALPPVVVEVTYATARGPQAATYTGALLWSLLTAAAPVDEPGRNTHLRHTLLAHGKDGYAVAVAIGELDPHMEGKQVIVAYAQDGKPLPSLRLVVPGDSHAGRSVRDLVSIEVR